MRQLAWAASTVAWLAVAPTAARAVDLRPGIPEGAVTIELDVVVQYLPDLATEFTPIDLVPFPDGTDRLAVSTVLGTIRVLDATRTMLTAPLLTRAQSGLVPPREAGMTGIEFHPSARPLYFREPRKSRKLIRADAEQLFRREGTAYER